MPVPPMRFSPSTLPMWMWARISVRSLKTDRAEADKKIAQAKAEEKRAMAYAQEQEMKARVQEMRAKVVEAESQVPLAMAEAFRSGNLGIMDYYKMQNISADTRMRDTIATPESGSSGEGQ